MSSREEGEVKLNTLVELCLSSELTLCTPLEGDSLKQVSPDREVRKLLVREVLCGCGRVNVVEVDVHGRLRGHHARS